MSESVRTNVHFLPRTGHLHINVRNQPGLKRKRGELRRGATGGAEPREDGGNASPTLHLHVELSHLTFKFALQ